jgi:hypothetical protein
VTLWCNSYGKSCDTAKKKCPQKSVECRLCTAHVKLKGDQEYFANELTTHCDRWPDNETSCMWWINGKCTRSACGFDECR